MSAQRFVGNIALLDDILVQFSQHVASDLEKGWSPQHMPVGAGQTCSWLLQRAPSVWELMERAALQAPWQQRTGLPVEPGIGGTDFACVTSTAKPKLATRQRGTSFFPPADPVLLFALRLYANQQSGEGMSASAGCPEGLRALLSGASRSRKPAAGAPGDQPAVLGTGSMNAMWGAVQWFARTFPQWCSHFRGPSWHPPHPTTNLQAAGIQAALKSRQPPPRTGGGDLLALYMDVASCGPQFEQLGLAMRSAWLNVLGALCTGGRFPLLTGRLTALHALPCSLHFGA